MKGEVKNAAVFIHPGSCFKSVEQNGIILKIKNSDLISEFILIFYNITRTRTHRLMCYPLVRVLNSLTVFLQRSSTFKYGTAI